MTSSGRKFDDFIFGLTVSPTALLHSLAENEARVHISDSLAGNKSADEPRECRPENVFELIDRKLTRASSAFCLRASRGCEFDGTVKAELSAHLVEGGRDLDGGALQFAHICACPFFASAKMAHLTSRTAGTSPSDYDRPTVQQIATDFSFVGLVGEVGGWRCYRH